MDIRLSWAGKKSYQPNFELPNAVEPKAKKPKATGKVKARVKSLCENDLQDTLKKLCSEVPEKQANLRKLTPAEIRAKRHAEKRYERRFKR